MNLLLWWMPSGGGDGDGVPIVPAGASAPAPLELLAWWLPVLGAAGSIGATASGAGLIRLDLTWRTRHPADVTFATKD